MACPHAASLLPPRVVQGRNGRVGALSFSMAARGEP
jgi:hypothetical protein